MLAAVVLGPRRLAHEHSSSSIASQTEGATPTAPFLALPAAVCARSKPFLFTFFSAQVKADATEYLTEIDANKDGALELEARSGESCLDRCSSLSDCSPLQEFLKYHEEEMKDPDNVKNPHPDQDPLHDY